MRSYKLMSILFEGLEERMGKIYAQAEDIVNRADKSTEQSIKNEAKAWFNKMKELEAKYPEIKKWAKRFKEEESRRGPGGDGAYRNYQEQQARWNSYQRRQAEMERAMNRVTFSILAIIVLLRLGTMAYESYKHKADDKCSKFTGVKRKICMIKARIAIYKKQIQDLTKQLRLCNSARNKEKCIKLIRSRIDEIQMKIAKLNKKLADLKG